MKKKLLSTSVAAALLSGAVIITAQTQDAVNKVDCSAIDCEKAAPYTLKIINHGEGAPQAANNTAAGLQQNRRVGVSVNRKIRVKRKLGDGTSPLAGAAIPASSGSGTFWVSQNPTQLEQVLALKVPKSATVDAGALESPIKISIASNYAAFIERYELRILAEGSSFDSEALHIIHGSLEGVSAEVDWNGLLGNDPSNKTVEVDATYSIALRVYDKHGNFDQTEASDIKLLAPNVELASVEPAKAVDDLSIKALGAEFNRNFAQQSISVSGSTVTVRGQDIIDVKAVEINGEKIPVSSGSFAEQYILPPGDHKFSVTAQKKSGEELTETLRVDVKPSYFFMVGIADLTVGQNAVTGSLEPLAVDEHHYGGDLFVDGRLAFYLKGKVRGKYLLTAQMDTGKDDISALFDDFHREDVSSVFRRIDPDQYYLVYGDDSTIVDDTNSQGKVYLRVDWDKSHAMWGNFNTAFSGTEYAPFNRSLYGAQYRYSSLATTVLGDTKNEVSVFASEAQTVARHNEFVATGGSLYYLADQDIVLGSEKIWVEVRRSNSDQVVQRIPLERGRDYEIDEFQGRIILTRPLLGVSAQAGPSIIRDEPQLGDNTVLVIDYEYVPSNFVSGNAATGVRGKRWINKNVAIGGTWVHENREVDDYDVKGIDITVKKSDSTYVRFEAAQSESSQSSGSFMSDDGGLTFLPFNSNAGTSSGAAVGVEARASLSEFIDLEKPVTIALWAKQRNAGFSTASLDTEVDTFDAGFELFAEINDTLSVSGRATQLKRKDQSTESVVAVQANYKASEKITVSGELRRVSDEVMQTDAAASASESATLAAAKVAVALNESLSVYGVAQGVLDSSGNYESNTLATLGARAQLNEILSLNGEISRGDRGTSIAVGAEGKVSDTYSVYGNVNLLNDSNDEIERGLTLGQRKSISTKLKVYTEHQFSSEDQKFGVSNTIGLSNNFNRYATGTLSFQTSRIEDDLNAITERDTLTAGFSLKHEFSHLSTKLEFRQDTSDIIDTDQWVVTNHLEYRQSPSTRWQGRFNLSVTEDKLSGDDAEFVEAGIGFAHRPVLHDRLNILGRYSYLYDLSPLAQSDSADRRSSIYSVEALYELTKRWRVGGKLAHREGQIRSQRDAGIWIGNDATLSAIRLRYKAPFGVDAMGSYHWLFSDTTDGMRQGALLSIGHNVGDNLQISVGYNFTSFDDNLANDDYNVNGWFLNLVGKY